VSVTDPGRTRHYGEFYGHPDIDRPGSQPLWLVIGNCQAEALRQILDTVCDRPFRTVRVPPVHELTTDDLPHLARLLRQAAVLLSQPIRTDYRGLPLGTGQLAAAAGPTATVLRWPVIRYAGLYPFQVIVRRPADRSVVPPPVPYHDLRTISAALQGRTAKDPWDVEVEPARFRTVAQMSRSTLAERERRDTDVGISDMLPSAGCDAAHAINHPGNTVLAALANRILGALGVPKHVSPADKPLLGSVYVPLEQRVLAALHLDGPGRARTHWWYDGRQLDSDWVHRVQMHWYQGNADFLQLAVERHRSTMDALGLSTGAVHP
jgi:hypothetical protein